jgi:nicotinate phosphoribosyltransferase
MDPGASPLLTDLYQLNMIEAYLAHGETREASFELFAALGIARVRAAAIA